MRMFAHQNATPKQHWSEQIRTLCTLYDVHIVKNNKIWRENGTCVCVCFIRYKTFLLDILVPIVPFNVTVDWIIKNGVTCFVVLHNHCHEGAKQIEAKKNACTHRKKRKTMNTQRVMRTRLIMTHEWHNARLSWHVLFIMLFTFVTINTQRDRETETATVKDTDTHNQCEYTSFYQISCAHKMEHPKRDALKWYLFSSVSFENMLLARVRHHEWYDF